MNKTAILCAATSLSLLTSCASVVSGRHQSISVLTTPVNNAQCALENNKGKWYIKRTPGSVVVHRSYKDLIVTCKKPGYNNATTTIKSKTKAVVLGNVLVGGAIGAGVDAYSGAAYEYPLEIKVPLKAAKKQG